MIVQETYVNATEKYQYGEDSIAVEDSIFADDPTPGNIYRWAVREYGRCKGKVYVDKSDGGVSHVGWVFERREKYEDSSETYLREVWVTLLDKDETRREIVYHSI